MNARTQFGMYVRMYDTRVYVCMYGKAGGVKVSCGSFFWARGLKRAGLWGILHGGVLTMRFSVQGLTGSGYNATKKYSTF